MTVLSLVLYVLAVVAGLILFGLYRQRSESAKEELVSDDAVYTRYKVKPSIFSVLGIQYYGNSNYFCSFDDHFESFDAVSKACRRAGLEHCQLIVGVDFTASNEWQGRKTFNGQCLHKIWPGKVLNPYQKVISILGQTLEPFDEDKLIPAFGFGDTKTMNQDVFYLNPSENPCYGFHEVLERYNEAVRNITLSGPTTFCPIIEKAIEIVKEKNTYHILVIIADGQINEQGETVRAIVEASEYPLSIIVVGVGDGPWDIMEEFDNCLPRRKFDNFQFVDYHGTVGKSKHPEAVFALHALMEVPDQYKTIRNLGYLQKEDKFYGIMGGNYKIESNV
ncbi:E3 ubiquitin-protein ligase RGLG5 [Octopus sinensis]|uniref:E3 ubiquitin-protein ligase RGLG5 n=1 Tax=Octopus sinensis TaxID=2607531 RepID=A0A6P7SHU3_9MOLL|nr:E3 ubiquitin-protein ligase RGLG5 [Octopus sinensis]XP_029637533.1 E3 ubiquitin-protein ligase RGLG5 [Octopus sinensis]XP_029637534.1 E3 ubiquitin-protein ligase RGLG5 [Octopus sinensis]XP_029637535.1 E3 ubiquitin-protein ligase RGLG5 [Octopus sinensis]XP_036359609.1 E3 ubiquitin-protein ligase RGLG5 [Octopus sinensis]